MSRSALLSRRTVVPALLVLALLVGTGLYLFQPWKAFTDTTVNESLPTTAPTARDGAMNGGAMKDGAMKGDAMKDASGTKDMPGMKDSRPTDLARGGFVSHEHGTSGTARTVRLADGSRLLRLEDLKTSEGPDVRVYLSTRDADAVESGLGDGAVALGKLKGNLGNQNYAVPAGTDLSAFHSAVIWCKRFSVSFGAADLLPAKA
ncbi:DM13 domain-containing protein [Streptomyces sp. NPDC050504]|uniref:DM13 domain-containing protein n=1 Tax=Streptomyces sp. NPDC050504 TaxID=3365618 RepID=UPI003798DB67